MATFASIGDLIAATKAFQPHTRQAYERSLLAKMVEKAERDTTYRAALMVWFRRGSTLRLRELTEPFGNYWRDLGFANVVDGLDSARARFRPAPLAEVGDA